MSPNSTSAHPPSPAEAPEAIARQAEPATAATPVNGHASQVSAQPTGTPAAPGATVSSASPSSSGTGNPFAGSVSPTASTAEMQIPQVPHAPQVPQVPPVPPTAPRAAETPAPPVVPPTPPRASEPEPPRRGVDVGARASRPRRSRRGPAVVVVAALLGALLGGLGSLLAGPTYTSEADVLWNPAGVQYVDATVNADPNLLERQVTDQVDVIMSDAVMGTAATALGADVDDLRDEVTVEVAAGSSLLTISGSGTTADQANQVTAAVSSTYVTYLKNNGVAVLNQRADVLQGTIDRQTAQLADLDAQLSALNDQLGGIAPTSPAYGALQGRIDRIATQIEDLTTRSADLVDQQESLRANAAIFPGEGFLLRQAEVPEAPSSLSPPKSALVGAALGLIIGGCIVAFTASRARSGGRSHGAARSAV